MLALDVNPISELRTEVAALRGEIAQLHQVLAGFAGTGGLLHQVTSNTSRISDIERHFERAKGAYSIIASACGLVGGVITGVSTWLITR